MYMFGPSRHCELLTTGPGYSVLSYKFDQPIPVVIARLFESCGQANPTPVMQNSKSQKIEEYNYKKEAFQVQIRQTRTTSKQTPTLLFSETSNKPTIPVLFFLKICKKQSNLLLRKSKRNSTSGSVNPTIQIQPESHQKNSASFLCSCIHQIKTKEQS